MNEQIIRPAIPPCLLFPPTAKKLLEITGWRWLDKGDDETRGHIGNEQHTGRKDCYRAGDIIGLLERGLSASAAFIVCRFAFLFAVRTGLILDSLGTSITAANGGTG